MQTSTPQPILLEKLLNRVEAFSLVHYLDAHGMSVTLAEPHSRAAMGEIPFLETAAELFLDDPEQLNEALALIRKFRGGPAPVRGPIWKCPGCGEHHEPEFGACWKCGAARP